MRPTVLTVAIALTLAGCGSGSSSDTQQPPPTEHLLSYGQSLSLGERAVVQFPTDDTIPVADNENVGLMFNGGTRPSDMSELVPYEETTAPVNLGSWNISTPGETPLYGALLAIKGKDSALHIGSAAGRGGTPIVDLSKGTDPYARLIAQVAAAKALSPGAYSVIGVIWMQGEADGGNANYATEFKQLVLDIDTDIRAITGQGAIQFYVCETAEPGIGSQQEEVASEMPQVHITCHCADYPHVSDNTHLTAAGSKAAGEALGAAIAVSL